MSAVARHLADVYLARDVAAVRVWQGGRREEALRLRALPSLLSTGGPEAWLRASANAPELAAPLAELLRCLLRESLEGAPVAPVVPIGGAAPILGGAS